MNIYIWIFLGIIVVLAVALVSVGLRNRKDETPFEERLNEYIARGEEVTLEEIELSQPIAERIIVPLIGKIGEITERFTPQNAIEQTEKKLELAGNPPGIDPTIFGHQDLLLLLVLGVCFCSCFQWGLWIGPGEENY